eukprot:scaffold171342_cov36-Prasinocladus_malaysianus.AAC.1
MASQLQPIPDMAAGADAVLPEDNTVNLALPWRKALDPGAFMSLVMYRFITKDARKKVPSNPMMCAL